MIEVHSFTFNPFAENTYILSSGEDCWIIDPGMYEGKEVYDFSDYIKSKNLTPSRLLLTHGHIDHILGNLEVYEEFGLKPWMHEADLPFLVNVREMARQFGMPMVHQSPDPEGYLTEESSLELGEEKIEIFHTPGHSPGSLSFYIPSIKSVISGDVLFRESIGRTDLPLCVEQDLYDSIRQKLYTLPDDTIVYPGHGPTTTIGYEKKNNPFVSE